jgi:hypothetical protein
MVIMKGIGCPLFMGFEEDDSIHLLLTSPHLLIIISLGKIGGDRGVKPIHWRGIFVSQ